MGLVEKLYVRTFVCIPCLIGGAIFILGGLRGITYGGVGILIALAGIPMGCSLVWMGYKGWNSSLSGGADHAGRTNDWMGVVRQNSFRYASHHGNSEMTQNVGYRS